MPEHVDQAQAIFRDCTRFLNGHYPQRPSQIFGGLAEMAEASLEADRYGRGPLIEDFERDIARLLGKEAAVFMPSGTMCQQIALRIWAEQRGIFTVAFHPKGHLELHEEHAYRYLHQLNAVLVGSPEQLMTLADLEMVDEPLGALLLELPQRELGGQLPAWDDLVAITHWAHEHAIALHLDGARLWECQPFYKRGYAEIAALFDTVYVSFYKMLGGIAGAILAGPQDIITQAALWQRRQGGNIIHLYPYILSARKGLTERLGNIERYVSKAREIGQILAVFPQMKVLPDPPHTNMMHVFMKGEPARFTDSALQIAKEERIWLFRCALPGTAPAYCMFELTVGDATLELQSEEIRHLFQRLVDGAA